MEQTETLKPLSKPLFNKFIELHSKENRAEWLVWYSFGIILIFLYGQNWNELLKGLIGWGFMTIGVDLWITSRIKKMKNGEK